MYGYHTDLILKVDIVLLGAIIIFTIVTILYAIKKDYDWRRRTRNLLKIKKNFYELILSGQKINNDICLPIASEITLQQFLDTATNRIRDAVFFNEAEQKIIKQCFVSKEIIIKVENIARNSWNKWRRVEAILALGYIPTDSSLNILKKSINGKDADIVYFSILALGQIRNVSSAKILLDFFKKKQIYQHKILSVLEAFPAEIAEEAIKLIDSNDSNVRVWALKLVSKLKPQQYFKKIEAMARDESDEVCAAACDCLGELGKEKAKEVLIRCLNHDFWLVRAHAVKALSKILGKECIAQIIGRINDPSLSVIDSVESVITKHIETAMPYIEKFLYGDDIVAKRVSVKALEASGYFLKLLKGILSENDKEKSYAVRILEGMVISRARFGLEAALLNFTMKERGKLLDVVRMIDKDMAEYIEKSLAAQAK